MIEQRYAHFERVRHAGPIHLGQDVARQIGLEIRVLDLRQRILAARPGHVAAQHFECAVALQVARKLGSCTADGEARRRRSKPTKNRRPPTSRASSLQGRLGAQRPRRPIELWVERAEQPEYRRAQSARHHPANALFKGVPPIAAITGEHLVPAVARQRHGDVLARHGADPKGRHRRAVAERLVVDRRQAVDQVEGVRVDRADMVVGAISSGDFSGITRIRQIRWLRKRSKKC